jgi:hypothetical protein
MRTVSKDWKTSPRLLASGLSAYKQRLVLHNLLAVFPEFYTIYATCATIQIQAIMPLPNLQCTLVP